MLLSSLLLFLLGRTPLQRVTAPVSSAAARRVTTLGRSTLLLRTAAPILVVAGTVAGEGRVVSGDALTPLGIDAPPDKDVDAFPDKGVDALPDKGVDAPPDKGVDSPPDKGVDAPPDKGVDASPDKGVDAGVGAPPDKDVDTPPDKGVDAPADKGSRTSPGKDSAGAIRVAILLLALSLGATATDDEPVRAFSTGSSSFALPIVSSATGLSKEVACSARRVNGQGRVLHPSVTAVETGPGMAGPPSPPLLGLWLRLVAGWSSARGVNGQGRSLHSSVADVSTEPNDRAPFSFSTRALAGLAAG